MKIELRLFASLSRFLPDIKDPECLNALEIEEGTTIRTLLDRLKFPHGQPTIIFLNGVHAGKNAVLKDGDRLGIFPPLAGG